MPSSDQSSRLIEIKVEAWTAVDKSKVVSVLQSILQNNPNISIKIESETGISLISADTELDLDTAIRKLKQQGMAITIGSPQVAFRETICRNVTKDYTHKRQFGDKEQYARVVFNLAPNERGAGNSFESKVDASILPNRLINGIEKGLNSVLMSGPIIGFPMVDLEVTLVDAAYHESDSTVLSFEIAIRAGMREALETAGLQLLEPIMAVDVTFPTQFMSVIISDIHSRRGEVKSTAENSQSCTIRVLVPLANMFGYSAKLNSLSIGVATFRMSFSHYQAASPSDDPDNFRPAMGMRL